MLLLPTHTLRHARRTSGLLVLFGLLTSGLARASDYEITPIATNLAPVAGADEAPVILADGSLIYLMDHRLMKSDGRDSVMIYEATEDADISPYSVRGISFNSRGDFVALCRAGSRQSTLVKWKNGQTELVDRRPALALGSAGINDEGDVAYGIRGPERLTQIMLHDGKYQRAVARSETLSGLTFRTPSINNRGQIAVTAYTGVFMIDTSGTKNRTWRVLSDDQIRGFEGVRLNDAGQIALRARRPKAGIFIADDSGVKTVADTSDSFASFGNPSFNHQGSVAFHAVLDDGAEGIFVWTDGKLARAVATGQKLGGSEVTALRFSDQGLNDQGEVAFWALLLDGTEGIYRGSPSDGETD